MIGNGDLTKPFYPTKLSYSLGDRFNSLAPPAIEQPHAGGLIIELPLEGCKTYLERVLSLKFIQNDETLINNLHNRLNVIRGRSISLPPAEKLELNIRSSSLYESLDVDV